MYLCSMPADGTADGTADGAVGGKASSLSTRKPFINTFLQSDLTISGFPLKSLYLIKA